MEHSKSRLKQEQANLHAKHLSSAQNLIAKKKYIEALKELSFFDTLNERTPELSALKSTAFYLKGFCWHKLSSVNAAVRCYKIALAMNKNSASALRELAEVYIELANYRDAKLLFEQLSKIEPKNLLARKGLVKVNRLMGLTVSDNSPLRDDIGDLPSVAEEGIYKNDVTFARRVLVKILSIDPLHVDTLNNLSVCDIMEEKIDDALKKIAIILQIDPDNETATANYKYLQERTVAFMS